MRVVSLNCSNTEIVCGLGCGDYLVGVDSDSDYPPEPNDQRNQQSSYGKQKRANTTNIQPVESIEQGAENVQIGDTYKRLDASL